MFKMFKKIENVANCEVRSVIRFLNERNVQPGVCTMSDSSVLAASQKPNSNTSGSETSAAFADAVQRARQLAAKIHHSGSDSSNIAGIKRPLEDMNGVTDGTPDVKKLASGDPFAAPAQSVPDFVIEEYHVPDKMVGLIIGRGGEQIIRLQAETGCKIQLASDSGGLPERKCTLTGNREAVQKVKNMITQIINKANSPYPPGGGHVDGQYTAEMMIPGPKVGLLIGKGGENIKNLQEKGGVKMVLIQDGPEQTLHEKPLRITGDPQKVEFAKQMVIDLLAQKDLEVGSFSTRNVNRFANGAGTQEEIMVPRQAVGVVIGKSGDMIKRIQNDSGARVQFIQGKEDMPGDKLCQISGTPDQVQKASIMIQELIQSIMIGGDQPTGRGRGRGRGRGGMGGQDFGPGGPRMHGPNDGGPGGEVQVTIPTNKCGLVIGKGGETIRSINQQSGAHVEIARNGPPDPNQKYFIIRGNPQQIEHAKSLICERIGMPLGPGGPPDHGQQGPPGQYPQQYPQQFQQPGPGQPYGAPAWGGPYQQWQGQPGAVVNPNDPGKAAADATAAAWAAYYAQYYGQPGQPQPGQMQPQPQMQQPAGMKSAAAAPAGQPDYSAAWAEYYRSLGMFREADMIEQQARANQNPGGQQPPTGAPVAGTPMAPPSVPTGVPQPGQPQPGNQPPASVTPVATPSPASAPAPAYAVYPHPGQQQAPGPVPYPAPAPAAAAASPYPGYSYPYGAQQPFVAPAQQ